MIPKSWYIPLSALTVGLVLGTGLGWKLWQPPPKVMEVYAPAVKQPDGTTILEKKPDPTAKPKHQVPAGAVVERLVEVTIAPKMPEIASLPSVTLQSPGVTVPPCPPVSVSLSLVRLKDGTRRVIVSSQDGEVSGVDIPVEAATPVKVLRNSAGASYYPGDKTYGIWGERDYGPIRVGVEVFQQRPRIGDTSLAGVLRVGIRF